MEANLEALARDLIDALAGEITTVVSALLQTNAKLTPSATPPEPHRVVRYTFTGAMQGSLTTALDEADARKLARLVNGMDEDPPEEIVSDTLLELCRQAAGMLSQLSCAAGCRITVDSTATAPRDAPTAFELAVDGAFRPRIAFWADVEPAVRTAAETPGKIEPRTEGAAGNLDVILDIELPLTVRFGEKEMTLDSLTRLGPGSIVDLGRSPDDPIEVMVNDKIVARGEVVVVGGNYGVRITEVISAAERIQSLGT